MDCCYGVNIGNTFSKPVLSALVIQIAPFYTTVAILKL